MNFLRKRVLNWKLKRFYSIEHSMLDTANFKLAEENLLLHIITVTYNNELLLVQQIELLRKNIKDSFVFIVADNSPDVLKRTLIRSICQNNGIVYVPLPKNPYKTSSDSHAVCLNWMYFNFISKLKPDHFGFIDHDLFAIKSHSIVDYLSTQPFYGHWQGKREHWYLWAGLCFFNYAFVKTKEVDFSPCAIGLQQMDTGGSNWKNLYCEIDQDAILFPSHQYIDLRSGESVQSDKIEIIGEWLHSFNGSYWMEMAPKEELLKEFLKQYL